MTSSTLSTQDKKPTLRDLIEQMKPEIARALPNKMNPDRMARIATTVLKQTPALARCTPDSFLGALMTASQLGLEPGPLGLSYLVPYGDKCTFIVGYKGLIRLARNSGQLVDVWGEIVYENDHFKQTLGLHRDLVHEPAEGDRGKPTHVYAAAELKDGGRPFIVMTVPEVEAIRARSKAGKNGPWVTDWNAMAIKTAIKQLSKWLPLSVEAEAAIAHDDTVRTDYNSPLIDANPGEYVDGEVVDQGAISPPAEVVFASSDQIAALAKIRKAENHDATSWADFVESSIGVKVTDDSMLTFDQADNLIAVFG
jgi:recombination protein RecT